MGNALGVIFQRDEQHGLAGQAVGDGLVQLGETVRQLALQHFPCARGPWTRRPAAWRRRRGRRPWGPRCRWYRRWRHSSPRPCTHNVRRCERIFQRGGVRVQVQVRIPSASGVGVGFVRQCGVVLGHEQLERLQRYCCGRCRARGLSMPPCWMPVSQFCLLISRAEAVAVCLHDEQL